MEQARAEYPGTQVPDMVRTPREYITYWRKLALWAYKFGPMLLTEENNEKDRRGMASGAD